MVRDDTAAVVGAGVIGAAVAYALTRRGQSRIAPSTGPSLVWRAAARHRTRERACQLHQRGLHVRLVPEADTFTQSLELG